MKAVSVSYTSSQMASAELHLERREEWRFVWVDGVRYAKLPSGTSGKLYTVRADARGCSCKWYSETKQGCSHMLSVQMAADEDAASATLATDDEIAAHMATSAATFRQEETARRRMITSSPFFEDAPVAVRVRPVRSYESLYPEEED